MFWSLYVPRSMAHNCTNAVFISSCQSHSSAFQAPRRARRESQNPRAFRPALTPAAQRVCSSLPNVCSNHDSDCMIASSLSTLTSLPLPRLASDYEHVAAHLKTRGLKARHTGKARPNSPPQNPPAPYWGRSRSSLCALPDTGGTRRLRPRCKSCCRTGHRASARLSGTGSA